MEFVTILASVGSVVGIIGVVIASLMYSNTRVLRDSNGDLRNRVADLEAGRERDQAENAELRGENRLLKQIATGEIDYHAITDLLGQHHTEANEHWETTEALLADILDALKAEGDTA